MKNIYWTWVLFLTVPFCKNVQAKFIETCDGVKPTKPPVPAGSPTSPTPPPAQTQPPEKKPATSV